LVHRLILKARQVLKEFKEHKVYKAVKGFKVP
jgi:hypothetical protein